jgi:hypothetical protein
MEEPDLEKCTDSVGPESVTLHVTELQSLEDRNAFSQDRTSFKAESQPLKSEQARILQTGAKFLQKEAPPVYTGAEAMQIVRFLRTD